MHTYRVQKGNEYPNLFSILNVVSKWDVDLTEVKSRAGLFIEIFKWHQNTDGFWFLAIKLFDKFYEKPISGWILVVNYMEFFRLDVCRAV